MIAPRNVLLAGALLAVAAAGQSPESRAADARAAALFAKAAAAQTSGTSSIVDFQAELEVTIHDTDEKTKERTRRSATVIQYYRDRGAERPFFRRHLVDKLQGTETVQGYDGNGYWQKLGGAPARDLRGRESKDERARIVDEIGRTRDYLRFLFLRNLDGPGVVLKSGGTKTLKSDGEDRTVEVVVREKAGEAPIDLFFGEVGARTLLLGFSRAKPSGKIEVIAFSAHRTVTSGGVTALVPLVAEYREDGVLTFEARCAGERLIKFNTRLPDSLFAMPR